MYIKYISRQLAFKENAMNKTHNTHTAIAVLTGKSTEHIIEDGGSSSWVLNRAKAIHSQYVVCCRSSVEWVEGPEPHGTAFFIGRVSGIVPSTEISGRWLITVSAFARTDIAGTWQGGRNPVRYTSMEDLGIDPESLAFEAMPDQPVKPATTPEASFAGDGTALTIAQAKKGLALTFSVSEDAIEITVRG